MTLFSKILSAFGVGLLSNMDSGQQSTGPGSRSTVAGITVNDDRALQVSAVWSCARLITEAVGSLPLNLYSRTADGREPLDTTHWLYQLLRSSPNQYMTPLEFREAMTLQLVLWGNAYALKTYSGDRVVALLPLRPEAVTVHRGPEGLSYHYQTSAGPVIYGQKSIFHIKGFGTDGVVGLSPLAYARQSLGISVAADTHAGSSFANGGRPGGVITFDKFLTPDQRADAKRLYEGISAGPNNANKLWTLEGGSKYESIDIPPDDLQMLETRSFQLAEIARFFRVPSHLINDSDKATSWGSGIEQLNIGFLQYTLAPYLKRWETTIADSIVAPGDKRSIVVEHQIEGLLRADSKSRAEFYSKMAQNGLMTRNEIRGKENLPPKPGGDDLTVQLNLTPVQNLEKITDA